MLTAQGAPEIIDGVAYGYPGDYEPAAAMIERRRAPARAGQRRALMLATILGSGQRFEATVHACGPSSGSGDYVVPLAGRAWRRRGGGSGRGEFPFTGHFGVVLGGSWLPTTLQ